MQISIPNIKAMCKIIRKIREYYRQRRDRRRILRAVRRADKLHEQTRQRCYVFNIGGRLVVMSTSDIKEMRRHRVLRPGVKSADIKRKAIYRTAL